MIADQAERTVMIKSAHEVLDATESRYEAGEEGPGPHVHHSHTDSFYVLGGELLFGLGPEGALEIPAPAGSFVLVPPNVVHTFRNASGARARYLNFHAPSGGFAAYLRNEPTEFDNEDPPPDGGRPVSDAVVSLSGDGERFVRDDRTVTILAEVPQLSALEIAFDPGFVVDPHVHDDHLDSFFVLEGEVELTVGQDVVSAGPGTWLAAPSRSRHGFRNGGSGRARVLNVHAPDAGFAESIRRR